MWRGRGGIAAADCITARLFHLPVVVLVPVLSARFAYDEVPCEEGWFEMGVTDADSSRDAGVSFRYEHLYLVIDVVCAGISVWGM